MSRESILDEDLKRSAYDESLKITPAIKHRNTAEEIISYAHRLYSLLLTLEKKQSIIFLLSLYHAARLRTPMCCSTILVPPPAQMRMRLANFQTISLI